MSLLLSTELPLENRKQQLEDEYRIEMTEELEKEMNDVCNLGEGIARRSRAEGKAEGRAEGENLLATLLTKLKELGRIDDAFRAASDPEYRNSLYKEFQLA